MDTPSSGDGRPRGGPESGKLPGDGDGRRCRAKSRRTGKQCGSWAVIGSPVCRMHGANRGAPIKHGRYSKVLGRIKDAYEAALADRRLLDLREPIAAIEGIVQRLSERATAADTPEFRKRAVELMTSARELQAEAARLAREADSAAAAGDAGRAATTRERSRDRAGISAATLAELESLLARGAAEDEALAALRESLSELARRIEGAWRVKLDRKNALGGSEIRVLLARFLDLVAGEAGVEVARRVGERFQEETLVRGGRPRKTPSPN